MRSAPRGPCTTPVAERSKATYARYQTNLWCTGGSTINLHATTLQQRSSTHSYPQNTSQAHQLKVLSPTYNSMQYFLRVPVFRRPTGRASSSAVRDCSSAWSRACDRCCLPSLCPNRSRDSEHPRQLSTGIRWFSINQSIFVYLM